MILAASLLLLLVITALLATGNGWSNVLSPARNELVFADRNRAYGAYVIRREHHRVMAIAFVTATALVAFMLTLPRLFGSAPSNLAPELPLPDDSGVIIDMPLPVPQPKPEPATAKPRPRTDPDPFSNPVVIDSTTVADPKDTTTRDTGPAGPVDPVGTTGPAGPTGGTSGGERDTIIDDPHMADTAPEYPGGMDGLLRDLNNMIRYPDVDVSLGNQGKVFVSFVVDEVGAVIDVRILRGVSRTIDAEAVRVVRKLKRWKPGIDAGKPVKVRYRLPINFKLAGR